MIKKVIFGNPDLKSNFLVVSPENFKIGIYNFEYVDYVLNFKRELEKSDFQGISFLENFIFDDISAWWLIHERFFYAIQPQINFIILFENFLQKHKPEIIEIKNHFEYFKLIQQICKKHKILLQYDKIYLQKFAIRQKLKKTFTNIIRKYRLSKSTKFLISNHKSQFVKKYDDLPSIKNKIIFATPVTYRRSIFDPKTIQFEYGEYLTKPLMEFLDQIHEDYLGISIPFMTDLSFSNIYEKRLTDQMKWIPEEYFLNNNFDSINQFLKKYSNLINNKKFHNLFSFNEINFWDSISGMFLQMTFLPYLPYWLSLYLGYCDVFESEKPKSIFIPSETDPSSIITISACKKFTIPTIGLQHGWFSLTGPPGYLQNSELNSHTFSYPFPSKMFVWGNVSKKLLITMGWPKNQITVFGNTYYHYLKFINKLVENPPFSKFNIDPSKKIILFTTTNMQSKYSFPGYVYDTKVWKYLLENFSNDNDFIIILKPHPHEDVSEFEKILNELKSTNSVILQGNLQELLSISDIVISNYSTVILDALAMKKPIIELNWPDIDENTSQYSSLMEHVEIKDLKNKIYELVRNYNFNEEDWSKIMNELFNIPLDENEIKNILMKLD
jgi:hypothetical protein